MVIGIVLLGCSDENIYTLYRDSPGFKDMRLHIATFDARESENYNNENCVLARDLFAAQQGVVVRYWCEKGRFRP
jgi:hypothetical protein